MFSKSSPTDESHEPKFPLREARLSPSYKMSQLAVEGVFIDFQSTHTSIRSSIHPSVHPSIHSFIRPSIRSFIRPSFHPSSISPNKLDPLYKIFRRRLKEKNMPGNRQLNFKNLTKKNYSQGRLKNPHRPL